MPEPSRGCRKAVVPERAAGAVVPGGGAGAWSPSRRAGAVRSWYRNRARVPWPRPPVVAAGGRGHGGCRGPGPATSAGGGALHVVGVGRLHPAHELAQLSAGGLDRVLLALGAQRLEL